MVQGESVQVPTLNPPKRVVQRRVELIQDEQIPMLDESDYDDDIIEKSKLTRARIEKPLQSKSSDRMKRLRADAPVFAQFVKIYACRGDYTRWCLRDHCCTSISS